MPLSAGIRLGPYEVLSPIGSGGMGEVYKARDTRLDRTVAVKVLPEHIARRENLRVRFEREARAVASLNHPNICVLHDIGNHDGVGYMVMEYMEGETLAARIEKGALSLDQALTFATQIADALDRAHRAGVTHRDVKPQNIMLTRDGVKVLDFGLAKSAAKPGPTEATLTVVLTTEGTVMGTPQYMAPEQFEGKEADARSDIWAFGAVLYEMVTGQKAFQGKSYSSLVGAILSADPAPMVVKPFTPSWLERLVRRCLAKDPEDRWQSMRDVVIELRTPPQESATAAGKVRLPWAVAAVMGLIAVALAVLYFRAANTSIPETRLDVVTPPTNLPGAFALSPDGRKIAYVATTDGASRLWVRPLDSVSAQPLPGTENARNPFWSPDSRALGFFADQNLRRIDLGGGQPQTLWEVNSGAAQGAWNSEGTILFNPGFVNGPLLRIPAAGGQAVAATKPVKGDTGHRSPRFLPGGRQFLFASMGAVPALWLGSLDDRGAGQGSATESRRITAFSPGTESPGEYLAPGWLVQVRGNVLVARRFDAASGQLSGDPVTLAQTVGVDPVSLAGIFSVSDSSLGGATIAWRSGGGSRRQLIWFNRAGQNLGAFGAADETNLQFPELSPDGRRAAVSRGLPGSHDIFMQEGTRFRRFTFDPGDDFLTIWSPDGASVVFASNRKGTTNLYRKPADGPDIEELLLQSGEAKYPNAWSPDRRFILYCSGQNRGDLMVLPMADNQKPGERKPFPFLSTPFTESQGVFSPDGKWVAYQSNESGQFEIHVRPFPVSGGPSQISTGGGVSPRWRADGKELYYLAPDNKLMAATTGATGAKFVSERPQALFQTHPVQGSFRPPYDVARDGRFLIDTDLQDVSAEPIHLLLACEFQPTHLLSTAAFGASATGFGHRHPALETHSLFNPVQPEAELNWKPPSK